MTFAAISAIVTIGALLVGMLSRSGSTGRGTTVAGPGDGRWLRVRLRFPCARPTKGGHRSPNSDGHRDPALPPRVAAHGAPDVRAQVRADRPRAARPGRARPARLLDPAG